MSAVPTLYSNIRWRVILDFASRGTMFALNILIARIVGIAEFGVFGYAVSLVQVFYVFTDLGTTLQLAKELGAERGQREERWINFLELRLFLMAACLVVFTVLTFFVWKERNSWLLLCVLFWMFSNSLFDFNQYVCNALGRMDVAREVMLLQRFLITVMTVVPLLWFRTIESAAVGLGLGGILGAWFSNRHVCRVFNTPFRWNLDWTEWKRILRVSFPLGIGTTFGAWYLRTGFILLGAMWSSHVVGEYTAAFRIFETTYLFPAAIMAVALPHLSASLREQNGFRHELLKIGSLMAGLGLVWMLCLHMGSPLIVRILLGPEYAGVISPLSVLSWAAGLVFINFYVTHLMVLFDFQQRHAGNQVFSFVVGALVSILFVARDGARGAAWGLVATEVCLFTVTVFYLLRHHRRKMKMPGYDTISNYEQ